MSFDNIPAELRALNQWLCWRYEQTDTGKPTKIPYNPATGWPASTTDPTTWVTFDQAVNSLWSGNYSGIGFVFSPNDPYAGIDLDHTPDQENAARQKLVFDHTTSYAELSPSGNGLHIIVRARVPHGRKRAAIEIYSQDRFFTFTGNVYRAAPINDEQAIVAQLWEEMGPRAQPSFYAGTAAPEAFDDQVIERMYAAQNGDKFKRLFNGDWAYEYPSQSEADQALMNIIAYFTQNRAQIARIFRLSALGQRDKARRDKYLDYTIDKAFDQLLPPIDISNVIDQINAAVETKREAYQRTSFTPTAPPVVASVPAAPIPAANPPGGGGHDGFNLSAHREIKPVGVLGAISDFIHAQAPRPVPDIALAGALGFMAGVCGRAWNVSGTGLNLYLMLLAATGRGKEAMASGINKIAKAVETQYHFPAIWTFIGPADMASGSGLLKHLAERVTPSMVSLTGEVGLRLQQLSSGKANVADVTLRRVLLDLYTKSGAGQVIRPTVYSDKKNNIELINSPAFTWLGESTPEEFYKGLDESQIASGLLPRFTIIEYDGPRVEWNQNAAAVYPSTHLTQQVQAIADQALKTMEQGNTQTVAFTDKALEYSMIVNNYADGKINALGIEQNAIAQLWNRLHLKVLKVAAILAVSRNYSFPQVTHDDIEWATSLCMTDVLTLVRRFEAGHVGNDENGLNETEQFQQLKRTVARYLMGEGAMKSSEYIARDKGLITWSYLSQTLHKHACFRKDKRGGRTALRQTLLEAEERGMLRRVSKDQATNEAGTEAMTYAIINAGAFLE